MDAAIAPAGTSSRGENLGRPAHRHGTAIRYIDHARGAFASAFSGTLRAMLAVLAGRQQLIATYR
jgi:hypothetical protein